MDILPCLEETNEMLCLPPRQFKKHISSSEDFDVAFAAKYLKCNPVSFLGTLMSENQKNM